MQELEKEGQKAISIHDENPQIYLDDEDTVMGTYVHKPVLYIHAYITYILYTCIHGELWLCCAKTCTVYVSHMSHVYMYMYMCFGSMCVCVWILLNMAISDAGF